MRIAVRIANGIILLAGIALSATVAAQDKTVNDGVYYYVFDVFNVAHHQKESFVGYVTIIK